MAVLSGCGSTPPLSRDTTLHVVATDYSGLKTGSPVAAWWNSLTSTFERSHPHIKVEVEFVPVGQADAKIAAMIKAGNVPDIAQLDSYSAFAAQHQLYSADSLFPISQQSDFIPSLAEAGSVNHTQYGIPWVASTRMLFYNKKLFADAGIKQPPSDWPQVRRDAQKLKDNGVQVPFGLPLGPQEADAEAMMWMLGDGGGYTNASGSYTFDSAANVEAFTWLKRNLVGPGLVGPKDPAKTNVSDAFGDFLAGRTGMLNGHLTLLPLAKAAHLDIGVAPLPGIVGPSPRALGNADWIMAFKGPGHLDADAAFLQFVFTPANMLKFQRGNKLLPVTADTAYTVRKSPDEQYLLPFMQLLTDAAFPPVDKPSWATVSTELRRTIGQAVHGDPKSVLTVLQSYAVSKDSSG